MSGTVSGVVQINGADGAGALVSLISEATGLIVDDVVAGVGGAYSFTGVASGRYQVLVYDPGQGYRSKVAHTEVLGDLAMVDTLPNATEGVAYSERITVTGGVVGVPTINVISGSVPAWMTLTWHAGTDEIEFSGTPTDDTDASFELELEDDTLRTAIEDFLLEVGPAGPGAHRYWRLYITANDGNGSFMGLTEFIMRKAGGVSIGTYSNSLGLLVSGEINASNDGGRAFDLNTTTSGWLSATAASPQYIGLDVQVAIHVSASPVEVLSFDIYGSWNAANASPKDFKLQYSDDGSTWSDAKTVSGETGWTAGELRTFTV